MSDSEDNFDGEPPVIEPYETLGLERDATADQVKNAYRKAALKNHPDKVSEDKKAEAHEKFQEIAFAYAILSDPVRRKRYDTTGSTEESILDADGFNWSDFYREQFQDSVSSDAIKKFSKKYKNSDEEKADILAAYEKFEGDMNRLYQTIMLSDPLEDEDRFQQIIKDAIENGEVEAFDKFTKESKKSKNRRLQEAQKDGAEAMDHAKKIGVYDKLFGNGKKESSESDLAALISQRQKSRAAGGGAFLDHLAEKYAGGGGGGGKKGKKRAVMDEPDDAAFEAMGARMKASKSAREGKKAKK